MPEHGKILWRYRSCPHDPRRNGKRALPLFLERSARLMTEETKRKLTGFRKILEPSLLLFVGLVTAAIIFSVLLPVFSAVGTHMGV